MAKSDSEVMSVAWFLDLQEIASLKGAHIAVYSIGGKRMFAVQRGFGFEIERTEDLNVVQQILSKFTHQDATPAPIPEATPRIDDPVVRFAVAREKSERFSNLSTKATACGMQLLRHYAGGYWLNEAFWSTLDQVEGAIDIVECKAERAKIRFSQWEAESMNVFCVGCGKKSPSQALPYCLCSSCSVHPKWQWYMKKIKGEIK